MPGLLRRDGFDYAALTATFDALSISRHRRPFYMSRAVAVIDIIAKIRQKNG